MRNEEYKCPAFTATGRVWLDGDVWRVQIEMLPGPQVALEVGQKLEREGHAEIAAPIHAAGEFRSREDAISKFDPFWSSLVDGWREDPDPMTAEMN